jgi:hypothetical protein
MSQVHEYIIAQERAGFTHDQIRDALVQQGIPGGDVEKAFRELTGAKTDSVVHEYAQHYAGQGMPPVQVFKTLTEQGYPPGTVRKAVRDVFGPGAMPQHHSLAFALVALFLVIGGLYFLDPFSWVGQTDGPIVEQPTGAVSFSVSEQIEQVSVLAREQGRDAGVAECQVRLRGDNRDTCLLNVAILPNVRDDALCDQIQDDTLHDACLTNFLDTARVSVCKRARLAQTQQTCASIAALQATGT